MEKISVIVPIYKVEKYLERCVCSIINQTYRNLEIILVDDGSPDACPKLCDQYAGQDARIQVIHQSNGGLSDARNTGIEAASGEYLAFVDSDDWLDTDMYQVLYDTMVTYGADLAECSYRNVYTDWIKEETSCTGNVTEADPSFALEAMLEWKYFKPTAWNKLYKRSVIGDIRYPKGRIHEDEFTTYKYFCQAKKLVYIDFSFYNYDRTRADSIMGEGFREDSLDSCEAFRERIDYFQSHGFQQLERKMNDIYCGHVLEQAYQCYCHQVNGKKVKALVRQAKKDLAYFNTHNVDEKYIQEFRILSKGILCYGMARSIRERK